MFFSNFKPIFCLLFVSASFTAVLTESECLFRFRCGDGQCVSNALLCDGKSDCTDSSDETSCVSPGVVEAPLKSVQLKVGDTFNLTCIGSGFPTPWIVWKFNDGRIPEKCRRPSVEGRGGLSCPDVQLADAGVYTCGIVNNAGVFLVKPDTVLTVEE
jgi:hypothetical protein